MIDVFLKTLHSFLMYAAVIYKQPIISSLKKGFHRV